MSMAFLFPGQGAQSVGMCKSIYDKYPCAKSLFDRASEILGDDLAKLCFEGPKEQLDSTVNSQPALFVSALAALEMLKEVKPDLVASATHTAGLSLGEYTALVFAGALTFEDGLRVVRRRGQVMQESADRRPSGMASLLMLEREKVQSICDEASSVGQVSIANFLCPGNLVISGEKPAVAKAVELAEAAGGKTVTLAVAGAFHTSIMEPADQKLAEALASVAIQKPRIPIVSNVDASVHWEPDEIRQLLVRQVVNPVRWEDSIRWLLAQGVAEFTEVGPGKVLAGLLKRIDRKAKCENVNEAL
ncbi:malonyl CoA-acyl carrier protein transacylase [Planctomycetia bacterium]|nr:malonyl CoA-acyl carrier protein transacylase [Planctomycetia bacterium]